MRSCLILGAVLPSVLYFIFLLFCSALPTIGGSSEAREVQVASVVATSGEFILPLRNGLVPSKPPLFHWLVALVSMASDVEVTPWIARAVSCFFGAATLLVTSVTTMRFARIAGFSNALIAAAGFLSAALLSLTYGFIRLSIDARVDMTFAFFVVAATAALVRRIDRGIALRIAEKDFAIFFILCGFAVLAKGPLGLVLPLVTAGAALASSAGVLPVVRLFARPRIGWILFIVIAVPWYVLAYQHGNEAFVNRQLIFENVARFFGDEEHTAKPVWYYLPSYIRFAFPWSLFLVWFFPKVVRQSARGRKQFLVSMVDNSRRDGCFRMVRVVGVWFLAGFILFSVAAGKRHSYMLPLHPAAVIALTLLFLHTFTVYGDYARNKLGRFLLSAPQWCIAVGLVLLVLSDAVRLPLFSSDPLLSYARLWFVHHLDIIQIVGLAAALVGYTLLLRYRHPGWVRAYVAWGALLLILSGSLGIGLAVKYHLRSFDRTAADIRSFIGADQPCVVVKNRFDEWFDPVLYYLKREVALVEPDHFEAAALCTFEGNFELPSRSEPRSKYIRRGNESAANSVAQSQNVQFVLTRRTWYEQQYLSGATAGQSALVRPALVQPALVLVRTYRLVHDIVRDRTDRDMVLLRCARE